MLTPSDVNETFSLETKKRPRRLKDCSRRDRDFWFWLQDETETFRHRDQDVFKMSQTVQPVKLLASNCYKLCCILFIYYAKHSSVSATVLQKLSRHFSNDCQQLKKTPLLYSPTFMHYELTI